MNAMRDRAKEHFPTVLLTLLSIVQALALELLWSHLHDAEYLFEHSWTTAIAWAQIAATFLGLILIWVVYASNAMRFRWVPVTSDSVYPFLIGFLEFMLIESLDADELGMWFIFMAVIFGMMVWVAHTTMRRARRDSDNDVFFRNTEPAKLRDFVPQITITGVLLLAGVYLSIRTDSIVVAMIVLLATNALLAWQFYSAAAFWQKSMQESQ